jgi:hypothetical protein
MVVPELSLDCFLALIVAGLVMSGVPRGVVVVDVELETDAIDSLPPDLGGWGNEAMLTDLRTVLSVPIGVTVPETDRIAEPGRVFPPREGREGGRSLEGDGDADLCASETVDKGLSFLGGSDMLTVDLLLVWLGDRGNAD